MKQYLITLILGVQAIFLCGAKSEEPISLKGFEADYDSKETLITLNFTGRVPFDKLVPEDHGTFIHVPLPGILVAESGKFFETKGPYVSKAAAFQFDAGKSAVRLFLRHDASLIKKAMEVDLLNDRVIISINHGILAQNGITDHIKPVTAAAEIISKTNVDTQIEDPASNIIDSTPPTIASITKKPGSIDDQLVMVTMFSGGMLFLLAGFYLVWGKLRARGADIGNNHITMKRLGSFALAPKRELALVQVGDQKILLGVSQDQINYLTSIDPGQKAQSVSAAQLPSDTSFQAFLNQSAVEKNIPPQLGSPNPQKSEPHQSQRGRASQPQISGQKDKLQQKKARMLAKRNASNQITRSAQPTNKEPQQASRSTNSYPKGNGPQQRRRIPSDEVVYQPSQRTLEKRKPAHDQGFDAEAQKVALNDVTSLIRQKLKDLPQI